MLFRFAVGAAVSILALAGSSSAELQPHKAPHATTALTAARFRRAVVRSARLQAPHSSNGEPVHTGHRTFWPPEVGNRLVAWLFAAIFVLLIASIPCILHLYDEGASWCPSKISLAQGFALFVWLITGLVCFTQFCKFQSPHFGGIQRTLTLVEAVYLFAQILTTVGYGDITPSETSGQLFIGLFVFCAISLIAGMFSEMSTILYERAERRMAEAVEEAGKHLHTHDGQAVIGVRKKASWVPLLISCVIFVCSLLAGVMFYCLFPGEGKTVGEGIYMSIITLTTVGFGAITPETESGMVFGAFWMLFGVAALGFVVANFTETLMSLRSEDAAHLHHQEEVADDILHHEFADHHGRMDEFGYLRYALLKYNMVGKKQLDGILKQFQELQGMEDDDTRVEGTVSCELVESLSAHVHASFLEEHGGGLPGHMWPRTPSRASPHGQGMLHHAS